MLTGTDSTGITGGQPPIVRSESLDQRAKRMQKALLGGNEAPYLVAEELHIINNQWDDYKEEAGGDEFTAWCKKCFGNGRDADYWSKRWQAMLELPNLLCSCSLPYGRR